MFGPFKGPSNFCNGDFLRVAVQFWGRLTGAPRKLVWVLMIDRPEGTAEADGGVVRGGEREGKGRRKGAVCEGGKS